MTNLINRVSEKRAQRLFNLITYNINIKAVFSMDLPIKEMLKITEIQGRKVIRTVPDKKAVEIIRNLNAVHLGLKPEQVKIKFSTFVE